MKIHVNRIPAEGYREEIAYDPAMLDVERFDLRFHQPIAVSASVTKTEHDVLVRADIRGTATLTCARCLEPFESPLETDVLLSYRVAPTDVLDITNDFRQELILAYPMIPVCRPDCKGLCRLCGQNLNERDCGHDQRVDQAGGPPVDLNPVLR